MQESVTLHASVVWLVQALCASLVVLPAVYLLCARYTAWGRQLAALLRLSIPAAERVAAALSFFAFVAGILIQVRVGVHMSFFNNAMYTSLQNLDPDAFRDAIILFLFVVSAQLVCVLVLLYLRKRLHIQWRERLTSRLVDRWLAERVYFRMASQVDPQSGAVDNPEQRIQQDVDALAGQTIYLFERSFSAMVSVIAFSAILWQLSASITILGVTIPRFMTFSVYIYVLVCTFVVIRVGRPLIGLNYLMEVANANLRNVMGNIRRNAESIAFYAAEAVEAARVRNQLLITVSNQWSIAFALLRLEGCNLLANRAATMVPYLIQGPRFFAKEITLGDVVQTTFAFNSVHFSLAVFRRVYEEFAEYKAVLTRLTQLCEATRRSRLGGGPSISRAGSNLSIDDLDVVLANGAKTVEGLTLTLSPGDRLLINGPSGCGKTTTLRALAGLWPAATGNVVFPEGDALFVPQRLHVEGRTLRDRLFYPRPAEPAAGIDDILVMCGLEGFASRLDEENEWQAMLSLGEQQKLALAGALLSRPDVLVLDEATSYVDEVSERRIYDEICRALPKSIVVSVGHRRSLRNFHNILLDLDGDGAWRLTYSSMAS